jgi:hypothetical protein
MEPLTIDMLRALAADRGLALTDAELAALLPVVNANRALLATVPPLGDVEPASQYRIL